MAKWIDIGILSEFPDREKRVVRAEQESLVICHVDGDLQAVQNVCPHAGMPIGEGELIGCILTCPFHGYAYNVKTGKNVDFEDDIPLQRIPVKVESDRVLVDVEEAE